MRRHLEVAVRIGAVLPIMVGFLATGAPSALAQYGTPAGDPTCPHGYDPYTYASNICYYGHAAYAVSAYNTSFSSGATFQPYQTKVKATMFTGAPCGNYMEGGTINSEVGGTYDGGYYEYKKPNQQPERFFTNGSISQATIYWYSGTDTFGVSFSNLPNPGSPYATVSRGSGEGCIEEAGQFVWSAIYDSLSGWAALSQQTSISVGLVGGGFVTTFGNYIIDNPCGKPGFNYSDCMNGQFTNGNTGWNDSQN